MGRKSEDIQVLANLRGDIREVLESADIVIQELRITDIDLENERAIDAIVAALAVGQKLKETAIFLLWKAWRTGAWRNWIAPDGTRFTYWSEILEYMSHVAVKSSIYTRFRAYNFMTEAGMDEVEAFRRISNNPTLYIKIAPHLSPYKPDEVVKALRAPGDEQPPSINEVLDQLESMRVQDAVDHVTQEIKGMYTVWADVKDDGRIELILSRYARGEMEVVEVEYTPNAELTPLQVESIRQALVHRRVVEQ